MLPAEALGRSADAVRGRVAVRPARRAVDEHRDPAFATVAADGIFGLVMPIAALIIGDSVLGAEVRAGTFHFTWLSPTPTWQIVLGRWTGGVLVALVTIAPSSALAAVIAGAPASAGPALPRPVGSAAYIGVFIAIAWLTRRTAVWSLAFVFLVERLLGAALTGVAQLSPHGNHAIFLALSTTSPAASSGTASPREGRHRAPPHRDRGCSRRDLAHEPHAPRGRLRLAPVRSRGRR